jgi:hypothetical protein
VNLKNEIQLKLMKISMMNKCSLTILWGNTTISKASIENPFAPMEGHSSKQHNHFHGTNMLLDIQR